QSGLGGTGYVNGGVGPRFSQRLTNDVFALNPDIVIFAGGINDSGFNDTAIYPGGASTAPAAIRAEADACFAAVRANGADLVVFSPFYAQSPIPNTSANNTVEVNTQVKAAAAAVNATFIDMH